jgi:hypothetical protein
MNRRLCRYAASSLAVLAIGCEDQPPSPPPAAVPGPTTAAPAPAPASKRAARADVPALGPSLTPLKD